METMLTNIYAEKSLLRKILNDFEIKNITILQELSKLKLNRILILATGSSINAAQSAKYFLEDILKCHIEIKEPFNFYNYEKIDNTIDLVIAISQSGKSTSTVEALKYVKVYSDIKTLVVTSDELSPIIQYSDLRLNLNIGIENVGFVTKGFSASILNMLLLGIYLSERKDIISKNQRIGYINDIEKIINYVPILIKQTEQYISNNKELLQNINRFIAISYGSCLGIAKECETKFTETLRCPTHGFEVESYMHGPYLEANEEQILIFIDSEGILSNRIINLRNYMNPYVRHSITIGVSEGDIYIDKNLKINEFFACLLLVVPIQLMSYHLASLKGVDLNKKIFSDFDDILKSKMI